MPLRQRLLALISLVLVVSLIGGSVLTYWQSVRQIALEMSAAISVGEKSANDAIANLSASTDVEAQLKRVVTSFDGDRHLRARLTGNDGTERFSSRTKDPLAPAPQWLAELLSGPPQTVSITLPQNLPDESLAAGRLTLETEPGNEISEVWDDMKLKLGIMAAFCLLVLASVYGSLGHALRPLDHLSAAFARIADGDYDAKVSEVGPKELANIYRQFNKMAVKLAASEQHNARLNEQLLTVQDEERAEIARDLHDEIGPFLFAVDVDAQTIGPLLDRGKRDEVIGHATAIRQSVGHMQTHLKSILSRLRPATLLDLGLSHAVDQLVAFWQGRRPSVIIATELSQPSFGPAIDAVAFRIFQEGTSNAIRHGKPTQIWLSVQPTDPNCVRITVRDNGSGFNLPVERGFGLSGMSERVADLGGKLTISAVAAGGGVLLVADVPLKAARPLAPTIHD